MCGTKLHTGTAGFTVLDHDGNTSFCHENSTLKVLERSTNLSSLCFGIEELPVMDITFVCEPAHTGCRSAGHAVSTLAMLDCDRRSYRPGRSCCYPGGARVLCGS